MIVGVPVGLWLTYNVAFGILLVPENSANDSVTTIIGVFLGVIAGYFAGPLCTVRLAQRLSTTLVQRPLPEIIGGVAGAGIGVLAATILGGISIIFMGDIAWVVGLIVGSVGISVGWYVGTQHPSLRAMSIAPTSSRSVLDSSFLIDPRCHAVLDAGLGSGVLLTPSAVMEELQVLADLPPTDPRQERGKHGLETAYQLRAAFGSRFQIVEDPAHAREPVDNQVISAARQYGAIIMTVDSNLATIAATGGIPVCNPNSLLRACQHPWSTGDELRIKIESPGRHGAQGIGHAPDGTTVVVDDALSSVGKELNVRIRRVQTTQSGAVIFAAPTGDQTARSLRSRRQRPNQDRLT